MLRSKDKFLQTYELYAYHYLSSIVKWLLVLFY